MDKLVCVFQRGAADGLNSLVPHGDSNYYQQRGTIAVPPPGDSGGAIDLDGFYGLHPSLLPLKPIYDAGDMALVHAVGIPHGSRSHFSAQGLVERGVADKSGPNTGWLGRHLSLTPSQADSAFQTVSISGNVPVSLQGAAKPLAISSLAEFGFDQNIIDSGYPTILGNMFHDSVPFANSAQAALAAMAELKVANLANTTPANGASYPNSVLGSRLKQAAQLLRSTLPVDVICIDSDGWDHHENLPAFLAQSLSDLANSIAAFYTDMGSDMSEITLLVMTEFGRRVAENASVGVDHGTAGLAYAIGGGVNGGQVFSDWPGLDESNLELGEDLKITTDLRTILAEMLTKRLGGTNVGYVFPEFSGAVSSGIFSTI
ncbi:MAG: DUF1501 domain-containing protein [Pseudomonadales bacterium]|nr:DUF1501 domain-containing protein [Pseudomonadales bacterium]